MQIATSICGIATQSANYKEKFEKIKKAGFDSVNLDMACDGYVPSEFWNGVLKPEENIFLSPTEKVVEYFKPYLDDIKDAGLNIAQAHAPFPSGVEDRPETIEYAIKTLQGCVKFCIAVGINNLVIHGNSLCEWDKIHTYEDIKKMNEELYTSLIPILKGSNMIVCLENMFVAYKNTNLRGHTGFPIETAREIDYYNSLCDGEEHFGYCIDIGHMNLVNTDIERFINILGKRIKCTHIHDNYGGCKDIHVMPYFGRMDYRPMLAGFKSIGYDGPICFETWAYEGKPKPIADAMLNFLYETGKYFESAIKGETEIWK